jgi:hypothetical protein
MAPAESRVRKNTIRGDGTRSLVRRSLPESKMRAVFQAAADAFREQSLQITFVE